MARHFKLSKDFDTTFGAMMESNYTGEFSQFVVMGAYAAQFELETVHPICCPAYDANGTSHRDSECATWLPLGVHYGAW
jgi:hypothetical protein